MRISTAQIFDTGTSSIQRNQLGLYKLQNQMSTGRRVLTPQDDPVAAAQALMVSQSNDVVTQYAENQGAAKSQLGILENNLSAITDLIQNVRERVIQGTSTTIGDNERGYIASELQARLNELVGLANAEDGTGQFLFSGYQGATRPFAVDASTAAMAPANQSPYAYYGDDGERRLQLSGSRQMPVNVSGADLLMNIRSGNGTFATSVGGNSGGGINQGTATIDAGSVTNPTSWTTAVNTYGSFYIEFSSPGPTAALGYTVYDGVGNALSGPFDYAAGQAIALQDGSGSLGAQVVVSGTPAAGDRFTVAPSSNQSLFKTIQNLIGALQTPVGTPTFTTTEFVNRMGAEVTNLDRSLDNISRIRADVGSRLQEVTSLNNSAEDAKLQYAETLSGLQDLDFTAAISDFTRQQVQLEAAQKSFAAVSRLSLFDIL